MLERESRHKIKCSASTSLRTFSPCFFLITPARANCARHFAVCLEGARRSLDEATGRRRNGGRRRLVT